MALDFTLSKTVYRAGSPFADVEPSHLAPEASPPQIAVTGSSGTVEFSDNDAGGTFSFLGSVWQYVPANRTQAVSITVNDSLTSVTKSLSVVGTFPIQPQFGTEMDTPVGSKVVQAKDNTPYFRRMPHSASWPLAFLNRTIMDVSVVKEFEFFHDIDLEFYFIDPELQMIELVRFDSSVKVKTNGANNFEMNCILKKYKMPVIAVPDSYSEIITYLGETVVDGGVVVTE